jgi:DNA-binding NarL/FixJ family response regulator
MKVIVVDDNKTFREGITYYLENVLNYEVINTAENGTEFLLLENTHEADIILMDVEMPGLNGIETAKKALWDSSFLRIIALTSYTEKAYLSELIQAGFKACIFKSEVYDNLEKTFEKVLANKICFPKSIKFSKNIKNQTI